MAIFLLAILYICFFSLGLPDGLLGIAWPQMRVTFDAPLPLAGAISMSVTVLSTTASFFSGRVLSRFGVRAVTLVSCGMTAAGIVLYAFAPSIYVIFALTALLGLGAGAIDSGLNHFVSRYYSARHMNWLHSFWGVGVMLGSFVFTQASQRPGWFDGEQWRQGYLAVGLIQCAVVVFLFATLPVWKKGMPQEQEEKVPERKPDDEKPVSPVRLFFSVKGLLSHGSFFVYCGAEAATGLWAASMLIETRGFTSADAGYAVTLYWGSLMAMRILGGFLVNRAGNTRMVYGGLTAAASGALLLLIPGLGAPFAYLGLAIMGGGFAPVYPGMMHQTARRFEQRQSVHMIGFQAGMAMLGCSVPPALMGLIFDKVSLGWLPAAALLLLAGVVVMQTVLGRILTRG